MIAKVEPEEDWPTLSLGIAINGGPQGPVRYTFHVGPEGAGLEVGSVESADVTLVESFETARSIVDGTSISDLLAEGRITVSGDANALVSAQRPLAAISAVFAEIADTANN
ncbi:MAG: hypothetical protein WB770_03495 [Acidimicrobiales bacterium]